MSHAPNVKKHSLGFRSGLVAAVLALQFFLASRGFALDPARDLLQYNCQTWSRQNGLPANSINAIAQTSDGYMWFGTAAGLLRFDGIDFEPFDLHSVAGVRNSVVTSLAAARSGGLWVGLENSAYGFCDGRSFSFRGGTNAETATLNVRSIVEGRDGTLWLAAADEAARLNRSGKLETVLKSDAAANLFLDILCGYEDRQGRLWFGTANHGVYCWQDGNITKIPDPKLEGALVLCIAEDVTGQIWVGTSDGLCCYDARLQRREIPLLAEEVRALLVDQQGTLWIGTSGRGLARYQHGTYEFLQKLDGLGNDYVRAIAEDREGSLWIGTRNGICQLSDVKFPIVPATEDPAIQDALSVAPASRGGVWISSSDGVRCFDPQTKTYATLRNSLPKPYAKRVFEASNGDLYVVSGSHRLVVFSGKKAVALYTSTNMIVGMTEDEHGVVVSVGGELYRAGTNYFQPYTFDNGEKPPFYWINNLAPGRDGVIWVASVNGIFRVKDGTCRHWSAEGLTDTGVLWVCEDQDGVVWAGLLSGIVRLKDNQARLISRKDGLFDNNIYSIVPDDLGNLWVDSERGIFRVTRQDMNDVADGKTNHVNCTVFDGINSVKVADKTVQERVGCKTADGRIWFPSPLGVVMIDPAHIPVNRIAPMVHIDRIHADGKDVDRHGPAVVPPGRGELEFHYDATSFIAPPKMRFRYLLEGYDSGWVDAGNRRLAFYTNLKPGRYTFRVIAANADGIWNETGDALEFELRPHFYQTFWFYSACGLAAFGTLLGGYLRRIRRLESKQRALQQNRDQLEAEVRRRTAELANAQQRLQFIFESMPVGVALARRYPDGRIERIINDAHLRICGLTREQDQIPGIYRQITHPEDAARQDKLGRELNDGRAGHLTMEKRYVRLDGTVVWVAFSFQRHQRADGGIEDLSTVVDITERKLAEAKLVETSALLETLLENTTDAIYFKDLQSRFVHFSREILKNFHLSRPEELTGKTDFDFFSEDHARPAFEAEQAIIRTGKPALNLEEKETHRDGRVSWALTSKMPWRDDAGNIIGTMGISRDITERKRMEIQFFQAQKMETVGKLAGGVAHEFNSILTAIICRCEMLLADLPPHTPPSKSADEILKAANRAAALTRQLLAYGRRQFLQPKILDLNQVLADMDGVLRQLMGEEAVEVNLVPAAGLHLVKADAGQIEQVILNMALNARDAMPNGGKLTVETANVALDPDSSSLYPELKPGNYVMLAITDNGTGMTDEVKARVFEPFFTTKDVGQGSGLGLSTCYGIIKQSGGHISVYSEPQLGTTFRIYLPQIEPPPAKKLPAQPPPTLPCGTETILMVEDDPALGKMTAGLLRRLGYTVLTATNGMEAMSLKQQSDTGHIDLLFTDVVIPLMNGKELANQMRALFPRIRILFTSGYTENASIHQGVMNAEVPFLQKPFTPAALAHKVREVLDRPEP